MAGAKRVNHIIQWVSDDDQDVHGYERSPGDRVDIARMEQDGSQLLVGDRVFALSELAPGAVPLTASGLAHTGAGEFLGLSVTAYSGGPQTVTVYDNTSPGGTIVAVFTVSGIGFYPWGGLWDAPNAGNGAKRPLATGCYVSISGGASRTIDVLVG